MGLHYQPPETTKTYLREYYVGEDRVRQLLGDAIQVFLIDIPGLEFGMLIPKREYLTVALLGEEIDKDLVQAFLDAPEVRACLPAGLDSARFSCQCAPRINVRAAQHPYADRLVFIGDCSATRLFKDGIGSAYRTAKVAAATAIEHGVSDADFDRHYRPVLEAIEADNDVGRVILKTVAFIRSRRLARTALLRMILREQDKPGRQRRMSTVQWDMFTGSASYKHILMRMLHPAFLLRLACESARSIVSEKTIPQPAVARHGDGVATLSDALGEC
jgi:flavin-dependent dehydrogenase